MPRTSRYEVFCVNFVKSSKKRAEVWLMGLVQLVL